MVQPRDLTAAEKSRPYSRYYLEPMAQPDPTLIAKASFDRPIDPAKALLPEHINDLLDPGYLEVETGWCILPNGAGYASLNVPMPGITVDMIEWWYGWHGLEDLRYMIWYPPSHYGARVSEADRAKILDPSRAPRLKFQGITHYVLEDVGEGGPSDITISFMTPEQLGFDMARFRAPNVGTVVGGQIWQKLAGAPADVPSKPLVMVHFVREIPGGVEYRTRFWMGYAFVDGRPRCMLPHGVRAPAEAPKGALRHNIEEYSNLRVLLPKLYKEYGGRYA